MKHLQKQFYRHFFLSWFWLTDRLFFREQQWREVPFTARKPILLLANHISWWDGAWLLLRNESHWKRRFNVLMLAHELRKRSFLTASGAIGLGKGRQQLQALEQLKDLANDASNMLLIFPEGAIQAAQAKETVFQMGLLKRLDFSRWQVVFVFSAVEYINKPRPTRFHFVQPYQTTDPSALPAAYSAFKERCRHELSLKIAILTRSSP